MAEGLFDLAGRTALVTGSSRGLGLAIARGLAEAGAAIVINGVDAERLEASAALLAREGYKVTPAAFDVTDEQAVAAAFSSLDAAGIEIDILVNNAGVQWRKPMLDLELADWRRVLDTNLTAAFLVGREAARRMVARNRGKIINIGSVMSTLARPTIAPYSVAKAGIAMLTQVMAAEWAGSGIQANCIAPGYMVTDMNEALIANPDFDAWVKSRTPSRRWGQPDELVGAAVFLSASASDYVNGQLIHVDGGMTAVV